MAKVFVTGPDGLLGSNVVRELIARGHQVTALVQTGREPATLRGLDMKIVHGDVTSADDVESYSAGHDYFIHIAAITDLWPSRGPKYFRVNVDGTQHAINAVLKNRIKRLVHVGSASSFGYGSLEKPGNEEMPFRSAKYRLDYIESKRQGQELVVKAAKEKGLPCIVVCPTFMIGPYDAKPSSGAMIVAVAKGKIPALSGGGKNWAAVKDVAVGVCNAMEKGENGACYILGGRNYSYKDAVKIIAESIGKKKYPRTVIPAFLIKFIGALNTLFAKITGKTPNLSYRAAWVGTECHYYSPEKAIRELNLPQTPLSSAVKEAFDWFKANNYL